MTSRRVVSWLLALALSCAASLAAAKSIPSCKTPRITADSVFNWQLGQQQSLTNAAKCFERTARTQRQLEEAARRMKVVFDAEGAQIDFDALSDDPEFLDDDRNPRLVPHARLPDVLLERKDGRWLWTRASLDALERHYARKLGWLDRVIDRMPAPLRFEIAEVALWQILALGLLVFAGVVVSHLLRSLVKRRMRRLTRKGGEPWLVELVDASSAPAALLGAALVLRLGYPQLRLPVELSATLHATAYTLTSLALFWAAYRASDVMAAGLAASPERADARLDAALIPVLRKSAKGAVITIGFVVFLKSIDFDVTALLASLSIGTLAFGLAAKDTLANFFGSLSIFVDAPFAIGDYIHVDGTEGTVEEVGFRSTRLRTPQRSLIVIPNAKLADSKIDNWGARRSRRCKLVLGLRYDTTPAELEAFTEGVRAILAASARVDDADQEVFLTELGAQAWNVTATFFIHCKEQADEAEERHQLLLAILNCASTLGVALAHPRETPQPETKPRAG
ncbi:MAG: mechanosensitive ion channel family protein [Myxococcales bacterium]|nr:mechanosensitive ion channel family protein [Myxococcales bacterium]